MNICVYLLKEKIFSKYIGMNVKEKPPDKYQCIKVPIQRILKKETNTLEIINDAVSRTNYITTKSYFLLRLWVLQKYHNNQDIPHITEDTIKMSMKSLVKASAGPKAKGNNLLLLQEFQQLHSFLLEDGKNLSATLDYYSTTMITAIENNIKMHFMDYVKRFVNSYFKSIHKEEIQNKEFKKRLYKELQAVKNDIINNTTTSEPKYHTWLNENRYKIVPQEYDTSYYYDIKVNPQRYLKYMIFMNLQLEEKEAKMFQFFPLQTQIVPRHIQLDTKSIIDLLVDTDKKQYLDNVEKHKEILWDKYFTIKQYLRKYDFDYTIITDGYAVSLRFLHKDFAKEERIKKDKMKNGKKALKGLTNEEKETKKQEKITQQNKIKEENKQKRVLETKQRKEQNIKINKKPTKETQQEFPYIDEVETNELEGKHIFIDPGKRSLLTMMDDDGNYLSYTNKQRICETKRMKYQALLKNYKDKLSITPKENTLSLFNSKTCNLEKFKEYITEKIKVNQELYTLYQNEKFRQYKWYSYINKKRTEDNMLNKIENKFGKDVKIIIGDWSIGKQMRNFISTPNLTIKRKLTTRFQVYNIDEFRTSCLNYITEEVCKNLYLPDKKKVERKMHSILTYKMENNRKGCINRDKNGCRNIQKVFKCYMETGERPEKYRREYKFNKID
jgi:N-acetylmuramoyl-L-alanine amidase